MTRPRVTVTSVTGPLEFTVDDDLCDRLSEILAYPIEGASRSALDRIGSEYLIDLAFERESAATDEVAVEIAHIADLAKQLHSSLINLQPIPRKDEESDEDRRERERLDQRVRVRREAIGWVENRMPPGAAALGRNVLADLHLNLILLIESARNCVGMQGLGAIGSDAEVSAQRPEQIQERQRSLYGEIGLVAARRGGHFGGHRSAWVRFVSAMDAWVASNDIPSNLGRNDANRQTHEFELNRYVGFLKALVEAITRWKVLPDWQGGPTNQAFYKRVRDARKSSGNLGD